MKNETVAPQTAIKILMLSPIYFLLTLPQRLLLVRDYCEDMKVAGFK